jgi:hypothetical protein
MLSALVHLIYLLAVSVNAIAYEPTTFCTIQQGQSCTRGDSDCCVNYTAIALCGGSNSEWYYVDCECLYYVDSNDGIGSYACG